MYFIRSFFILKKHVSLCIFNAEHRRIPRLTKLAKQLFRWNEIIRKHIL